MKEKDQKSFVKARLVGLGNRQDLANYDFYRDISSPTAFSSSIMAVITQAAAKNKAVMTIDVGQAFLNAEMTGVLVHVRLDKVSVTLLKKIDPDTDYDSYMDADGSVTVVLDKALYGCVESARLWYEHLSGVLSSLGYIKSSYDDCLFNKFDDFGVIISSSIFHVDDGLIIADTEEILDTFLTGFMSAFDNNVKVHRGRIHNFLGMHLDFTDSNICKVHMQQYIADVLSTWNIVKARNVPAKSDLFSILTDSPVLSVDQSKLLHRGIAQLLYLATHVRPDILCPTIFLTTRVQCLTVNDMSKFIHVLEYLHGSSDLGIILGGDVDGKINLKCYADASFGVHVDGKSHSGIFITYGRGPIIVKSSKQKVVSKSSCESELITLSDGSSMFVRELDFAKAQQFISESDFGEIFEDNKSTIHMANTGKSMSDKTRHIKLRYFFVKQFLDNGDFVLTYCPTEEMIADILTKPLQGKLFLSLRAKLLGYEIAH